MKTISRYIMTLALLITAVGGAWAQETLLLTINSRDYTSFTDGSKTFDDKVTVTFSDEVRNSGDDWGWYARSSASLLTVAGTNGYTITSCKFYTEVDGDAITGYTIAGESPSVYLYDKNVYTDANQSVFIGAKGVTKIEVYGTAPAAAEPDVEVTTNAAEEGATFTEATFAMPAFDATAEYELVRDMSVQMTATMGDGTDGLRYRVKKAQQGEGYEPADMDMMQVLTLVAVNDGIEHKALTMNQDYYCLIYKLDEQTQQPEGDGVELVDFDFAPGLYALKAFALDDSNYAGETDLSNTFQLFQGYEITVPAGEYATFFKGEPLCADATTSAEAELYTITEVNATEAVLSDKIDVVPSETPMLIYNPNEVEKTFLLIPADAEPAEKPNHADQFQGTLDDKTFTDVDMQGTDYYVCTGNAFVWVKSAGTIAANRCWLEIVAQPAGVRANTRSIVSGGDTTNIDATTRDALEGDYYDLQGRKVEKPLRKGIYIKSGKKVIKH